MYRDPVCGMEVDPKAAQWQCIYHGETYYFCSLSCRETFEEEPESYLPGTAAAGAATATAMDEPAEGSTPTPLWHLGERLGQSLPGRP